MLKVLNVYYSVMLSSSWKSRLSAKACIQDSILLLRKPVMSAVQLKPTFTRGDVGGMLQEHITGLFTLRAAHSKYEGLPKLGDVHCFVKKDQSCIRKNAPSFWAKVPAASLLLLWFKLATDGTLSYSNLLGK